MNWLSEIVVENEKSDQFGVEFPIKMQQMLLQEHEYLEGMQGMGYKIHICHQVFR